MINYNKKILLHFIFFHCFNNIFPAFPVIPHFFNGLSYSCENINDTIFI